MRAVIDERSDPAHSSPPAPLPERTNARPHRAFSPQKFCLNSVLETEEVALRSPQHRTVPHQPHGRRLSWQRWPFVLPVCSPPLFLRGCGSPSGCAGSRPIGHTTWHVAGWNGSLGSFQLPPVTSQQQPGSFHPLSLSFS